MQSTLNDVKTFANDAKSYKESVQKKTSEAKGALDAVDLSEAEKKAESEAKEQASKAVKEALAGTDLTDDQKAEIQAKSERQYFNFRYNGYGFRKDCRGKKMR